MRRIARLPQQPSAVLTKCLHSQPTQSARSKAAAATGCLASRPRAFTTTSARSEHPLRPWTANKAKPTEEIPSELATESLTTRQPKIQTSSPEVNGADYHDTAAAFINEDPFSFDSEEPQAIATDLILPPIERTTAPRADDLNEAEYEAAHNATGLPVVGGLAGWFSEAQNHWGPSKSFASFANEAKVTHPAQLELCARRAVLEALAVRSARVEALLVESWRADGGWESVMGLGLTIDGEGKATVEGDVKGVVAGLVGDVGARETMMSVDQAREIVKVTNTDWKRVSLKDAKLKFAVAKRIFQLTGHAIPDAKLLNVHTMGGLLATVVKPEPARKVYEAVQRRGELAKLPNVSVYESRRTPVHVAKDLGRWKVIEKELEKRGLPVLGPDNVDKFREREWFHGPQPEKKEKKRGRRKH